MIDYRLITFITLAKLKNYTRTAEHLNLTQPAVTQHIHFLEDAYGVLLVVKGKRQVHLTDEGKLLLEYAKKIHSLSVGISRALKNKTSILKKYKVGATLTLGEYILPNLLGHYKQINPHIDISMHVENTEMILQMLNNEQIDLALVEGPFKKEKYNYNLLKEDELIFVASPTSTFANKKQLTIEEILSAKLILREPGSGTRKVFENALLTKGYTLKDLNLHMEIGNLNAIKTLVKSNLGCTIISREVVKEELASKALCSIPIIDLKLEREFNFVYLQNSLAEEFINKFMTFCIVEQSGIQ